MRSGAVGVGIGFQQAKGYRRIIRLRASIKAYMCIYIYIYMHFKGVNRSMNLRRILTFPNYRFKSIKSLFKLKN